MLAAGLVLAGSHTPSHAGLRQPDGTPLKQFGYGMGPEADTLTEVTRNYDVVQRVIGAGGIIRTGLTWDPTVTSAPDFNPWSAMNLAPALQRNLIVMPRISTRGPGGYRYPSDTQWTTGLRQIVRMYGPGGIYARGGSYVKNGRTIQVAAHAGFAGLTDFELWNEPDSNGSMDGYMTPARVAHLIKLGSIAMRDEARKLGFRINIIGPGYGGIEVSDLANLWKADNTIFDYLDTYSVHAYSRFAVSDCVSTQDRCIKNFQDLRDFLDSHGGSHVHLASTEGTYSGTTGTCLGPQVLTEQQQADYSEQAFKWLRSRPHLDLDFWISFHPVDSSGSYGFNCDSGIYDNSFYKRKLGVVRPDMTMKPLGTRLKYLMGLWR